MNAIAQTRLGRTTGTASDARWARVIARDRSADGFFWYSVATTKIYCRPSCPSRTANPKNVGLHDTLGRGEARPAAGPASAATRTGYRSMRSMPC